MQAFSKRKKRIYKKNKEKINKIARERINILFKEAEKNFKEHPQRSHRYSELIRKISLKYQIELDNEIKRRLCRKCNKFMVPGKTCTIRIHNSRIIYKCNLCKNVRRIPFTKNNEVKQNGKN